MILIADSGLNKNRLASHRREGNEKQFYTKGFNPNYTTEENIVAELRSHPALTAAGKSVTKLFFYGSGCSEPTLNAMIERPLKIFFPSPIFISGTICLQQCMQYPVTIPASSVFSEPAVIRVISTARSAWGNIQYRIILVMRAAERTWGNQLLRDYFYEFCLKRCVKKFRQSYLLTREEVIEHVYRRPRPNEFIASFIPFLKENISHPYCDEMVRASLREFLKIFVLRFTNLRGSPCILSGRFAWVFSDLLKKECAGLSLQMGNIIRSPINGLASYHLGRSY